MFCEGSAAIPDGLPVPGGSDSVWQPLARVLGSAGFMAVPGTVGGGVRACGMRAVTPRREAGQPSVGQPSVDRLVRWGRQAGLPAEFLDRLARMG